MLEEIIEMSSVKVTILAILCLVKFSVRFLKRLKRYVSHISSNFKSLLVSFSSQTPRIYLHSLNFTVNPSFGANVSMSVFNDTSGVSCFNMSGVLLVDLKKIVFSADVKSSDDDGISYNNQIMKANADVCTIFKGIVGNFIIRLMTDSVEKYSNLKIQCPMKAKSLYISNFPMVDDTFFPPLLLGRIRKWEISAAVKAATGNVRTLNPVFNIKIRGEVVH